MELEQCPKETNQRSKKRLGSGSFGNVYLGEFYYLKGQLFALKKVVNTEEKIAKQEIQILAGVDEGVEHPNIIKYHMATWREVFSA